MKETVAATLSLSRTYESKRQLEQNRNCYKSVNGQISQICANELYLSTAGCNDGGGRSFSCV